ncbi:glutamate-5-semialdehyde dehydrogenase [Bdellovibrio sp. HCB185ZH]|uniref:glutamate-5-semialdehyde dehydrogenase n=1 Tax=Bdellovibrio sp. HCB185ZH TaxID=3394235 RepID=UPI0039A44003
MNSQNDLMLADLKKAAREQRKLDSGTKNKALLKIAEKLTLAANEIIAANSKDLEALAADTAAAFRDRLTLNPERINGMIESLRQVAALPDPVGEMIDQQTLKNGLLLKKIRAPLGVIFMIFESRPNVILEAFSLAFKSGNVILLRGGSESKQSAAAIYKLMRDALTEAGFKFMPFHGIEDYDRGLVEQLLKRKDMIDIVVPRGGDKLIDFVQRTALMPIIKNDRGMCHTFVDEDADLVMAAKIVTNAKTQRPGVCNALETVLVHEKIAAQFLPMLYKETDSKKLQWHVDSASLFILKDHERVTSAKPEDWDTEYLDLIMNCRVVSGLDEALAHIEKHGSKHSEAIITKSETKARLFQQEIDAAAVYWNVSTRFTDGFEFGLGGELGISTQKLHVRGPVGLRELTNARWLIDGSGQTRG